MTRSGQGVFLHRPLPLKRHEYPILQKVLVEGVAALNIRNAPSLDAKRLGRIQANQEVEKLGEEGKWYQVRVGTLEGWAYGGFLKRK